jgi:hypothetical protein
MFVLTMYVSALAKTPFDASSLPAANEDRYAGGLMSRLYLAQDLIEQGDSGRGYRHLRAVERRVNEMKDGFVFLSGKRVEDEALAPARDERGYVFGIRRQGSPGKSYALSALARFYTDNRDLEQAKALIRRIPSDYEQLRAAERLVSALAAAGHFDEAVAYRRDVLEALGWKRGQLATIRELRLSRQYKFASKTAFSLFEAYVEAGKTADADKLASTMAGWLDIRNASDQNPDVGEYRQLATTLIRYYIDTGRKNKAQRIADACTKKWREASVPDERAYLRSSLEYNREKQLALYKLIMKQPARASFRITSGNLSRLPESFPARFVGIEILETTDVDAARLAYFELGKEINSEPRRCKRYLKPVIDALVRLGDESAAIELVDGLQGNLPQEKIKGCPVTAFQYFALSYAEGLDLTPLLENIRIQESKLKSVERLRISGVDTARAYAKAGAPDAALRLINRCSDVATSQDYSMMRGIVTFRHEAFGEIRDDEVRRLVQYAQADIGRTWKRKLSPVKLASVARLLVDMERYDWAETLIDALSPESRIELASGLAQNSS